VPRAGRVFLEGGIYHVNNRVSRGGIVFDDEEATAFVGLLREVKDIAAEFSKSPEAGSRMVSRGIKKRRGDARFRKDLDALDRRIARSKR